jgi:hypothetical protein
MARAWDSVACEDRLISEAVRELLDRMSDAPAHLSTYRTLFKLASLSAIISECSLYFGYRGSCRRISAPTASICFNCFWNDPL